MSEALALISIGRAARNADIIREHGGRTVMAVFCIVRLADIEQMAGAMGPESAEFAIGEFKARMQDALRSADEMIPLSTRTWALLLKGITSEDHVILALARLERLLAEPVIIFDEPVMLRVNLGYQVIEGTEPSPESVFWMAERSLEEAKSAGLIAPKLRASNQKAPGSNWVLERELRQALEDGEFRLHFQPKIDATFRQVVGAEALVRWYSRKRGVVAPGEFIEVIEHSDLAAPFTHFIFKHALALASAWPGELSVAVNLPPSALSDESLSHTICDALAIFDIDPGRLEIEITEGTLMHDLAASTARLAALRKVGVQISIDDFGTGHSSLAQLKSLPVNQIKIDRSFVAEVTQQPELVKYIIDLAHALKLSVVAEGVEQAEQARILKAQGANFLQGYWIAKPMPQEQFIEWLGNQGVR